jgi:hypothetical protein
MLTGHLNRPYHLFPYRVHRLRQPACMDRYAVERSGTPQHRVVNGVAGYENMLASRSATQRSEQTYVPRMPVSVYLFPPNCFMRA